jgi:hypothetical protein
VNTTVVGRRAAGSFSLRFMRSRVGSATRAGGDWRPALRRPPPTAGRRWRHAVVVRVPSRICLIVIAVRDAAVGDGRAESVGRGGEPVDHEAAVREAEDPEAARVRETEGDDVVHGRVGVGRVGAAPVAELGVMEPSVAGRPRMFSRIGSRRRGHVSIGAGDPRPERPPWTSPRPAAARRRRRPRMRSADQAVGPGTKMRRWPATARRGASAPRSSGRVATRGRAGPPTAAAPWPVVARSRGSRRCRPASGPHPSATRRCGLPASSPIAVDREAPRRTRRLR